MKQAGLIEDLQLQPRFQLRVNDVLITTYVADFRYKDRETGEWGIEDVKRVITDVYTIKRSMMQVLHGIGIREVRARPHRLWWRRSRRKRRSRTQQKCT